MTKTEMEYFLISELLKDTKQQEAPIPQSKSERFQMLRSIFNIRSAKPSSSMFMEIQDQYLQGVLAEKGITDLANIQPVNHNEMIYLWQGDITTLKVDAIVNAANSQMLGCFIPCHACIDNAIHTFAGIQLRLECDSLMKEQGHPEPIGMAKITKAYNLPSEYIIHTVGPIVNGKLTQSHCDLLASCYRSCLSLAIENDLKSIAFCCISTGVFGFPRREAANIAVSIVRDFLKEHHMQIIFNVFTDSDLKIYSDILS